MIDTDELTFHFIKHTDLLANINFHFCLSFNEAPNQYFIRFVIIIVSEIMKNDLKIIPSLFSVQY